MRDLSKSTGLFSKNIHGVEVISNQEEQIEKLIAFAKEFDEYYYIFHDKDVDENGNIKKKHIHLMVWDKGGTSFPAWCGRFADIVPANMIQHISFKAQAIRYLTHETAQAKADGKYIYDRAAVCTNQPEKYLRYFQDSKPNMMERLADYQRLKNKELTIEEYVEKYRTEIDELNFYQQNRLFGDLLKYGL